MRNVIVIYFDFDYVNYAYHCVQSIKKNYPDHPEILIFFNGGYNSEIHSKFSQFQNLDVHWIKNGLEKLIDFDLSEINMGIVNNPNIYFKYILWTNYFDEFDNVLYLDADTLVLGPLDELISQNSFIGVSDNTSKDSFRLFYPDKSNDEVLRNLLEKDKLGYPDGKHDMLNAGVLLVPKSYRTNHNHEKLITITKRYNDYLMFADQSAISLWCISFGIKFSREFKYNFQTCFYFDESLYEIRNNQLRASEIRILHYTWWKPQSDIFKYYLQSSRLFLDLSGEINSYDQIKLD